MTTLPADTLPADQLPIDKRIARQAAEWLMRLGADNVSAADIDACARWRALDGEHERAWQRAQQIGVRFGAIPSRIGMATLGRGEVSRRDALKLLSTLIAAVPAAWLAQSALPWREWTADVRTATGERRELALPDGSALHLNTASAVDLRFDAGERRVMLRTGEILIETAPDPMQPPRPFRVATAHGLVRAIGTRFVVRNTDEYTHVAVLDGAVDIRPHSDKVALLLQASEQTQFDARTINVPTMAATHASDWSRGLLHAEHMPLREFLAELSRYRHGVLRCDAAIAQLPVSGIYQLGDIEAILQALPDLLPVRVQRRTAWWITVAPA